MRLGMAFQMMILRGLVRRTCGLFVLLLLGATSSLSAKDLHVLSRILYEAFLADQGSAMCNLPRLPLSNDDRIVFVNARNYANWIKQQISMGLPDEDVQLVLRSAADRAHEEMLEVVRAVKSNPPERQSAEIFRWCTGVMKGIADKVVSTYVNQPDVIEGIIKKAKED